MWVGGSLLVHGSLGNDSRTLIDGMVVDAMFATGQCSCVYDNEAQTQEMAVQVTGGSAENQLSGVLVNRIPAHRRQQVPAAKAIFHLANGSTQSVNLDDAIRARGITTPDQLYRDYDINYSAGGPILKDKLWFFVSGRNWAYNNYVANAFNKDGSQAIDDNNLKAFPARLTWQADSKNRFTTMFDWANKIRGHRNLSPTINVDAAVRQAQPAQHILQAKWTSTLTNHLLFETGYSQTFNAPLYTYQPQVVVGDVPRRRTTSVRPAPATAAFRTRTRCSARSTSRRSNRRPPATASRSCRRCRTCTSRRCRMSPVRTISRAASSTAWATGATSATTSTPTPTSSTRTAGVRDRCAQHADRQPRRRERRSRRLPPGHVDDQAPDAQPRRAVRSLQLVGPGAGRAGRPVRAGAPLRRHPRRPQLEQRRAAPRRLVRSHRPGAARRSRATSASTCSRRGWASPQTYNPMVFSTDRCNVERTERRRHRPGERAEPTSKLDVRRPPQPEPRSRHQAAVSVAVGHRRAARGVEAAWPSRSATTSAASTISTSRPTWRSPDATNAGRPMPNPQRAGADAAGLQHRPTQFGQVNQLDTNSRQQHARLQGRGRLVQHAASRAAARSTAGRQPAARSSRPATSRMPTA